MERAVKYLLRMTLLSFVVGCSYHMDKGIELVSTTPVSQNINSFDLIKKNILDPKCLRCHTGGAASGQVDVSSYNTIMSNPGLVMAGNPSHSRLYTEVESGSMPEGGPMLSAKEIESIKNWIIAGAVDGEFGTPSPAPTPTPSPTPIPTPIPTPTPTPVPLVATYTNVQTKIFQVSCVRCHTGSSPSGRVNLSSYSLTMGNSKRVVVPGDAANSLAYTEITSHSMPPSGSAISPALVLLLKDWINQGAKNN